MKKTDNIFTVDFRGEKFDVNRAALLSMKVQSAMTRGDEDPKAMYKAIDLICCGKSAEYFDRMPEEDGTVSEFGATAETFAEFIQAATKEVGADSKN